MQVSIEMKGHCDTVTCLSLSPDGNFVLSNSMDNTVRMWDVRPFAPANRCLKAFVGAQHNFEKNLIRCCWSPQGTKVRINFIITLKLNNRILNVYVDCYVNHL